MTNEKDFDELTVDYDPADDVLADMTEANEDARAKYAAKFEDPLEVWRDWEIEHAVEVGAITPEQAATLEAFDEEAWERRNTENEKRAREAANAAMRVWLPAWRAAFGAGALSPTHMARLVQQGAFAEQEALALLS